MRNVFIVIVIVLLAPLTLLAQSNEVGVFFSSASYGTTHYSDPAMPSHDIAIKFGDASGAAVDYNRYWTPALSTEISYGDLKGDVSRKMSNGGEGMATKLGDANLRVLSGTIQWHFLNASRATPYLGGGVARIDGRVDKVDADVELDAETAVVADAGIAYAASERIRVVLDAKYIAYSAKGQDIAPVDLDIDPLVLSAGIRFAF